MIHRKSWFVLSCLVCLCGAWQWSYSSASARPPYKKIFDSMYVKADSSDATEKTFATEIERVKCNVCHMPSSKKERNAYGKALATLLSKNDAGNADKIHSSLEKVADMKSDPNDPTSPTFGELIKQGRLPGGEPPAAPAQ